MRDFSYDRYRTLGACAESQVARSQSRMVQPVTQAAFSAQRNSYISSMHPCRQAFSPQHFLLRRRVTLGGRCRGFTILELMASCAVIALLTVLAIPSYQAIMNSQKSRAAIADIRSLGLKLQTYALGHDDQYPPSLATLGLDGMNDPWGNPYQYLNLQDPAGGGRARKDHNLHPINTYFDLYSMGPDGQSNAPLTAHASRDDVIWANDGNFVGVASDY